MCSYMYKNNIRVHSNTIHKNKLKTDQDLNVRPGTIKLSEENIRRTLIDISCSKIFLDPPPREITIKTKINGT